MIANVKEIDHKKQQIHVTIVEIHNTNINKF